MGLEETEEELVYIRRFLNKEDFYNDASVIAKVKHSVDYDTPSYALGRSDEEEEKDWQFNPYGKLQISDCDNKIYLQIDLRSDEKIENSLHKVRVLKEAMEEMEEAIEEVKRRKQRFDEEVDNE